MDLLKFCVLTRTLPSGIALAAIADQTKNAGSEVHLFCSLVKKCEYFKKHAQKTGSNQSLSYAIKTITALS